MDYYVLLKINKLQKSATTGMKPTMLRKIVTKNTFCIILFMEFSNKQAKLNHGI